jgi:GT2 family glycosyltransferase
MKFSFVVPYRNREPERVSRCVASLQAQIFGDFEIVFIDYGSDQAVASEIAARCTHYPKVRYLYLDTRGWFWSRAHAVNLGLAHAQGELVAVVDIDLIYSPDFLAKLAELDAQNGQNGPISQQFYHYQCYYLPESFTDYASLDFARPHPYPTSTFHAGGGLVVVPRRAFAQAGYFDEYFRVWGVEDMDMTERLQQVGYARRPVPVAEAVSFHQWHPKANQANQMPTTWYDAMELHWHARKRQGLAPTALQYSLPPTERPALAKWQSDDNQVFTFEYPLLAAFSRFAATFAGLPAGEGIMVHQRFDAIPASAPSRLAKGLRRANHWLARAGLSYRLTELRTFETALVLRQDVRDFLFYFIAENAATVADYFFDQTQPDALRVLIIKK